MTAARPRVTAVFFDVGETLLDETTEYHAWADWLGVPRHTFSAVFGEMLAAGRDYRETFGRFRPDFDLAVERQRRAEAGRPEHFTEQDLYPDARACLAELCAAGYFVGIAGNQTARAEGLLRGLDLPADLIATSASWGAEKPSVAFFEKLTAAADRPAAEILYVGDRLDNDIRPARAAGLRTAFLRRGPWGYLYEHDASAVADLCITSLSELPALLPTL